jgi:hypothetical protein
MTNATLNRFAAPFAAAALTTATVVAPVVATSPPNLPTFSTSNFDIELTAGGQVFNPDVPLINWDNLAGSQLTPIPQILAYGLQNPLGMVPVLETLSHYLTAIPAMPLALAVAGPSYALTELSSTIPGLDGIASGYTDFAQTVAGGLSDLPLIGDPIHTAFAAMPLISQWLTSSVLNPLPTSVFDTSGIWQDIGAMFSGGIGGAEASSAAGTEFLGVDLSGVQSFLTGLPNINDILGFNLSEMLGPLGILAAPLDLIGLSLMIPLALPLVGLDMLFGGGLGDLLGGGGLSDLFNGFGDLFGGGGIGDLLGGAEATAFAEPNFLLQSLASDFVANPAAASEFMGIDLSGFQSFIEGLPNIDDLLGFSLSDALGPLGLLFAPLDVIGLGLMIPMALPLVGADLLFGGGLDFADLFGGFGDLFGGLF